MSAKRRHRECVSVKRFHPKPWAAVWKNQTALRALSQNHPLIHNKSFIELSLRGWKYWDRQQMIPNPYMCVSQLCDVWCLWNLKLRNHYVLKESSYSHITEARRRKRWGERKIECKNNQAGEENGDGHESSHVSGCETWMCQRIMVPFLVCEWR